MKNELAWKMVLLILIVGNFCGCGGDDIGGTKGSIADDVTAPEVTGGTVTEGEEEVDYEKINESGVIEVTFSEEVTGSLMLLVNDEENMGWIGNVEGTKGTLKLRPGLEIGAETIYVIKGEVADAAGNKTEVSITFVTRSRE